MPFRSAKQRAYLKAQHPEIAARWEREHGNKIKPKAKARAKAKRPPQR